MWDIKLKATNEQDEQMNKTNKQKLIHTEPKGKGGGGRQVKRGQIYGDGRRYDFGW